MKMDIILSLHHKNRTFDSHWIHFIEQNIR